MPSTASCPDPSSLPDFVNIHGIPGNVSTGFVPVGRNGSYEAMTTCCLPSVVSIASDCYYWCELPKNALDGFEAAAVAAIAAFAKELFRELQVLQTRRFIIQELRRRS
ncbi:hypothetical protein QIS74_02516 [Colletotrichum tabaci]|uniref:Uncharacterized protein n=1 Tax=Colletotrichum tabaci TaxID=1209068 RepID=A0AAV9TSR0_9PEZI